MMTPSAACLALIRRFETLQLVAYWDEDGWAIGYGHHGPEVVKGLQWQQPDTAEAVLLHDATAAGNQVLGAVDVVLSQGQFDALVDFVYNEGIGHLEASTLLHMLNQRNYIGASQQFILWDIAGGSVNAGLLDRRRAEAQLFLASENT